MVPNSLGPGELLTHYGTSEQKEYFLEDKESAKNYLSVGDKPYDSNVPVEDIAALGVLATAIFNLWESMAKF